MDRLEEYFRQKWEAEHSHQLHQVAERGSAAGEFLHSFTAGVALPGLQAVITGGLLGLAAGMVAGLAGWSRPWAWGLGSWAVVQACTWSALLWRWLDLTKPLERVIGLDLDNDGYIGDPEELPPPNVRIELVSPDKRQTVISHLPCTQAQLVTLSTGLLAGQPFSESEWTGAGRPFSRREFRDLREEMLKRGMLAWRNEQAPSQGMIFTAAGLAAIRYFASLGGSNVPTLRD
jgi:hypothetical protein